MGLIRSGNTELTPMSDNDALTKYLWPIVCEMIKTVIENKQSLIIEGCYIPFDWKKNFTKKYLDNIRYYCLIMSENYIRNHFDDIKKYGNVIENRLDDENCTLDSVLKDNAQFSKLAQKSKMNYILIDDPYKILIYNNYCLCYKNQINIYTILKFFIVLFLMVYLVKVIY